MAQVRDHPGNGTSGLELDGGRYRFAVSAISERNQRFEGKLAY